MSVYKVYRTYVEPEPCPICNSMVRNFTKHIKSKNHLKHENEQNIKLEIVKRPKVDKEEQKQKKKEYMKTYMSEYYSKNPHKYQELLKKAKERREENPDKYQRAVRESKNKNPQKYPRKRFN